jgi:hypothetical protein
VTADKMALAGMAVAAVLIAVVAGANGVLLTGAGDGVLFNYPMRIVAGRMLASGVLPVWNPYVFGGIPLLAAVQAAVLYPATWLFAVLSPPVAMNILTTTTYAIALAGTYACARRIGCSAWGSVVASVAFGAGGFMVAQFRHANMVSAAAWLPVVFMLLESLRRAATARVVALLAVALALQCFAGHVQIWLYTLAAVVILAGMVALGCRSSAGRVHYLGGVAAAIVLAGSLAAVQLLPAAELKLQSTRVFDPAATLYYSLPTAQVTMFLFPFLFGDTAPGTLYRYWGGGNLAELSGYVGLIPVMLIVAALPVVVRRRARPYAVLAAVSLLVTLKDVGPTKWLLGLLPGFNAFPATVRVLVIVDLCAALLAGLAVTYLARMPAPSAKRLVARGCALVGGVMLALALALVAAPGFLSRFSGGPVPSWTFNPIRPGVLVGVGFALASSSALAVWVRRPSTCWRTVVLVGVLVVDLGCFAFLQSAGQWPVAVPREPEWMRVLRGFGGEEATAWRFVYYAQGNSPNIGNLPAVAGLRSLVGYEAFLLRHYAALMGDLTRGGQVRDPELFRDHRGLDMLTGKYLVVFPVPAASLPLSRERWRRVAVVGDGTIYENLRVMPRAWLVAQAKVLSGPEALAVVRRGRLPDGGEFDPARLALLERVAPASLGPPEPSDRGEARILRERPDMLEVVTRSPAGALLVLGEIDYPGWSCRVDGERAPTLRVNHLLRAVPVAGGQHRVECAFRPASLRLGALMSLVAAVVLVAGCLWSYGRHLAAAAPPDGR